jgi:hypothetical protein
MDHFREFFPSICAGLGLFLTGAVNLALVRKGIGVRAAATGLALGVALAAAAAIDQPGTVAGTARLLALGLLPFALLASRRVMTGAASLVAALNRPVVRFAVLTFVGVGVVLGSIVVSERDDELAIAGAMAELEMLHGQVPTVPAEQIKASTDRGTRVVLKEPSAARDSQVLQGVEERYIRNNQLGETVMRRSGADDHTNCHGWVFTGGKFLVSGDDVETILKDNGYREHNEPQPGDLVVYRLGPAVTHTAIVRYVTEGQPLLVEGKWGNLGVFVHPADKSPYGTDYKLYRSPRRGHLLAGAGGPTTPSEGAFVMTAE